MNLYLISHPCSLESRAAVVVASGPDSARTIHPLDGKLVNGKLWRYDWQDNSWVGPWGATDGGYWCSPSQVVVCPLGVPDERFRHGDVILTNADPGIIEWNR